jgi:two-component system, response regulator
VPVSKNPASAKRPATGKTASGPKTKSPAEILMVEDSATDSELALRAFKRARIANPLKVIPSGEQALDYLLGTGTFAKHGPTRPLLILLDLQLSGMPGLDFLRQVKLDERLCDIPVVTLSITKSAPSIVMCLQLGVDDHIIKPVDFDALLRVTKKLKLKLTRARPEAAPPANTSARG